MMLYSKLLENIILPLGDSFFGTSFIKELKKWRQIQYASEEQLLVLQEENLGKILTHAVENVSYYKENVRGNKTLPLWLKSFPIVGKADFKTDIDAFLSVPKSELNEHMSSGSSGTQGSVFMNKKEETIGRTLQVLWWEWAGYKIGQPFFQTGMTPQRGLFKGMKDLFFRTKYYNAFGLSDKETFQIMKGQEGKPGYSLGGYASSLFVLSEVARKNNLDVKFKSVISWGDKLFTNYRRQIEEVFNTKVFDTYGCTEGIRIACQKDLDYYYIMTPHVYVEILDENDVEVADGEIGHVVVTRLDAFAMPLIRYRLGDLAVKLPLDEYPNNRELAFPLLKEVIGRDTDIVRTPSGRYLIVHFFTGIFEFYSEIKQFKIIQNDLSSIDILYVPGVNFQDDILIEIEKIIRKKIDEEFGINFLKMSEISNSSQGKPRIVESNL